MPAFLSLAAVKQWYAAQAPRLILWSPAGLMIGIAWYFSLRHEPPVWIGSAMLAATGIVLALSRRLPLKPAFWLCFLVALGFAAAQYRAHSLAAPLLTESLTFRQVEAVIAEVAPAEGRTKLVLEDPVIEGLSPDATPKQVRISFRGESNGLEPGDTVRLLANLYPLPDPTMPGAYDFARHFYFQGIGGNGFAMRPPDIIEKHTASGVMQALNALRHRIGEDMRLHMQGATGAVAATMTVSETGSIPPDAILHLRDSGLAHMLSISGLHLSIAAGIVFFSLRLLLSLSPALALRMPVKKIAATLAIFGAFFYLCLAGMPVPAQRSFIMVTVVLLAVLLDRRGLTMRTLAMAAFLILLIFPETLSGPSFQMSFAATLAIIALYDTPQRRTWAAREGWLAKLLLYVGGIALTSLAATLATAPFVLYHFNRFALFGLIANMVVIPLAGLLIMPGIVLSLLLMPFGWQEAGYVPLRIGVDIMLAMAAWVTSLPYATVTLPSLTAGGLVLCSLGMLWLCLWTGKTRLLGIALAAIGLGSILLRTFPDLIISDDGRQVLARLPDERYTLLKGSTRSFTARNWMQALAQEQFVPLRASGIACSKERCDYTRNGHRIVVIKTPRKPLMETACAEPSDILIAWWYLHAEQCPGPRLRIGRNELARHGAHALWLSEPVMRFQRTYDDATRRIWQPPYRERQRN